MTGGERGFGFVETLVGVGIATTVMIGLLASFQGYVRAALHMPERVQANFLAEEGLEALRVIRDENWNAFAALEGETRHLTFTGAAWQTTTTPEYIDGMLRSFTISGVSRGAGDDIVVSGGTNDPQTKKVEVTIAWRERGATTTLSLPTYFMDIHAN